MAMPETCPCGTGRPLARCCGRHHSGEPAPDAEALMRSRYSAYVLEDAGYLLASWHPRTRPAELAFDAPAAQKPTWLGLKVHSHRRTSDDTAEVEFVARYRVGGGRAVRMRERSRFVREQDRWFYLDGEHPP